MFKKLKRKKKTERKVRSDKRVEVRPTISIKLKTEIERLSYILDQPVKDVVDYVIHQGIRSRDVVSYLSQYFQVSGWRVDNAVFSSVDGNESLLNRVDKGPIDRVSTRMTEVGYRNLCKFATILGVSPTRAAAIIIDAAIRDVYIIEELISKYNRRGVVDVDMTAELRLFMKYINRNNPYSAKWSDIINDLIGDGIKRTGRKIRKLTEKMIDRETYKWTFDDD